MLQWMPLKQQKTRAIAAAAQLAEKKMLKDIER